MSLESAIAETQRVLGPLFKKPSLTEKYLSRPPFRFLHDIVTSTMRETGFPSNFFTAEELEPSNFEDKSKKIAFLAKIIDLLTICHGHAIDVRASKIVAGLEPINTNELLVALGKASTDSNLDRQLAIQYCLEGKSYTQVSIPRLRINSSLEQQQKTIETLHHETPRRGELLSNNTLKAVEAEVKAAVVAKNLSDQHLSPLSVPDKWNVPCNGDLLSTREMIEKITNKPRCTDKLLERPPFSFLYDLMLSISRATNYGTHIFDEIATGATKDKNAKISFLEKVIDQVQHTLRVTVGVKPGQVIAGLEVEKTRQLLQFFVVAATISKSIGHPLQTDIKQSNDSKVTSVVERADLSNPQIAVTSQERNFLVPSKALGLEESIICDVGRISQSSSDEDKAIVQNFPSGSLTAASREASINSQSRVDSLRELITSHPGEVSATKQMIESIVIQPKVSEKLLDRPPFRFLHDLIISITRSTGYGLNFLTEQDIDFRKINSKEGKIEFLEKIICQVERATGQEIDIRAAKIVSGLEGEKTRLFLQLLVLAATSSSIMKDEEHLVEVKDKKAANGDRNDQLLDTKVVERGEASLEITDQPETLSGPLESALMDKQNDQVSKMEKETMSVSVAVLQDVSLQRNLYSSDTFQQLSAADESKGDRKKIVKSPLEFLNSLTQRHELKTRSNIQILASRPGPPSTECRTTRPDASKSYSYFSTQKVAIFKDDLETHSSVNSNFDHSFLWDEDLDASQRRPTSSSCTYLGEEHSALVKKIIKSDRVVSPTELSASEAEQVTINLCLDLEDPSTLSSTKALSLPLSVNSVQNNLSKLVESMQSFTRSIGPLGRCLTNYKENLRQMAGEKEFWVSECLAHNENLNIARRATERLAKDEMEAVELEIKDMIGIIEETKLNVQRNQYRIRELVDSLSAR